MLVLGHAGITLGIAALSFGILSKGGHLQTKVKKTGEYSNTPSEATIAPDCPPKSRISWFNSVANYMDIRFLLLGSLLPDLIDKPIGIYLFHNIFGTGRIFCHTLLFTILIALAGLYLFRRSGKTWLLAISFGTFMHLVLDEMWLYPQTLLWPSFGLTFYQRYLENWLNTIVSDMLADPSVFIPELAGAAILIWFALLLVRRKKVFSFIKYGQV